MLYTDQLSRQIELPFPPKRIISLVPSQTELLYDLGLRDEVVGITKFCIHPNEWFRSKTRVGGTKKYDFEKIKQLKPDLIIGNKEENEKDHIDLLMRDYKVWMSDIYNLENALDMIMEIGTMVGKLQEANYLRLAIESQFYKITHPKTLLQPLSCAYFIWQNPFVVVGNNTFINHMLNLCGLKNVFASDDFNRYPEITLHHITLLKPDIIMLSSEPYPFKEKHIKEFKALSPRSKIMVVDGELFSWYGSRLLQSPAYFENLISSFQKAVV